MRNVAAGVGGMVSAGLVLLASVASATPLIGFTETWSSPPSLEGWQIDTSYGGGGGTLDNPSGYLRITFPDFPAFPNAAMVYADSGASGGNFVGDYSPAAGTLVQFWFRSVDTTPDSLALYFANNDTGRAWSWNLTAATPVQGWVVYQVPLFNYSGWNLAWGTGSSSMDFMNDLASVDWLGLYIAESVAYTGEEHYYLDNFTLAIPEPESVALLLAAALSLGVTFRRRLGSTATRLRSLVTRT